MIFIARMSSVKLTLSVPKGGVLRAKRYAKARDTTVSSLVNRFFNSLEEPDAEEAIITSSALGLVTFPKGKTDKQLLADALVQKHL